MGGKLSDFLTKKCDAKERIFRKCDEKRLPGSVKLLVGHGSGEEGWGVSCGTAKEGCKTRGGKEIEMDSR